MAAVCLLARALRFLEGPFPSLHQPVKVTAGHPHRPPVAVPWSRIPHQPCWASYFSASLAICSNTSALPCCLPPAHLEAFRNLAVLYPTCPEDGAGALLGLVSRNSPPPPTLLGLSLHLYLCACAGNNPAGFVSFPKAAILCVSFSGSFSPFQTYSSQHRNSPALQHFPVHLPWKDFPTKDGHPRWASVFLG